MSAMLEELRYCERTTEADLRVSQMFFVQLQLIKLPIIIFTSPAGAKHCDECVCLSVCKDISGTTCAIFINFLCLLPMSVARSSFGILTIGRIAYRREGGDGSAQRGRSVIYDCLVYTATIMYKVT